MTPLLRVTPAPQVYGDQALCQMRVCNNLMTGQVLVCLGHDNLKQQDGRYSQPIHPKGLLLPRLNGLQREPKEQDYKLKDKQPRHDSIIYTWSSSEWTRAEARASMGRTSNAVCFKGPNGKYLSLEVI